MKTTLAFLISFAIGFVCRKCDIPLPAPNALLGVGLIVAITLGYLIGK